MEREIKNINYQKLREALKGTQSEKNIEAALIDEALARARYTCYAKSARANRYE